MRATRFYTIAVLAAAIFSCRLSCGQDAASAKAFLESVYRQYRNGFQNDSSGVAFYGPHASLYFHSSLLALEKADVKANAPDIPAIDWDPICSCQDWDGIWDLEIDVKLESSRRAHATVSFSLRAPKYHAEGETRKLLMTLATENGGWRIWDILDESDPKLFTSSVRKILQDDLTRLRSNPAPSQH